uniref:AlNc14C387G11266 protein n=1 Tax=Albugo laibachii Nc14 TaxID=890382 RepID=F0WYK3_9STRA|nr:AlNc14C387G11266 [Albugo laibachii Nc14]|eukprot:CCA26561.1 AlNc14C387G11266 [Albugo laibachii Nc14]
MATSFLTIVINFRVCRLRCDLYQLKRASYYEKSVMNHFTMSCSAFVAHCHRPLRRARHARDAGEALPRRCRLSEGDEAQGRVPVSKEQGESRASLQSPETSELRRSREVGTATTLPRDGELDLIEWINGYRLEGAPISA